MLFNLVMRNCGQFIFLFTCRFESRGECSVARGMSDATVLSPSSSLGKGGFESDEVFKIFETVKEHCQNGAGEKCSYILTS